MEDIKNIQEQLLLNGYCIIPNILTQEEIDQSKQMFYDWKNSIKDHDYLHNAINPHGIYKFHNVGHTRHAWFIRTRPAIINIFKQLWKTDNLIVSFDGCCYIPKDCTKQDKCWTHTDQASNKHTFDCYQGFVSLTDNEERTLRLYQGSHLLHKNYFEERNISNSKNWNLICPEYLETIAENKMALKVPAGSLVLWDSRTFHQNQYGSPNSEERIVQYVCYFPKQHKLNSQKMIEKRLKYFNEYRTTSHWPCPIKVNSLQPQTYGDNRKIIDYQNLKPPELNDLKDDILKLL